MRFIQQANLIIMLAMFWALAAVVLMDPFYGIVTALVLALFSLLIWGANKRNRRLTPY